MSDPDIEVIDRSLMQMLKVVTAYAIRFTGWVTMGIVGICILITLIKNLYATHHPMKVSFTLLLFFVLLYGLWRIWRWAGRTVSNAEAIIIKARKEIEVKL